MKTNQITEEKESEFATKIDNYIEKLRKDSGEHDIKKNLKIINGA
jgi:hypothetical protein